MLSSLFSKVTTCLSLLNVYTIFLSLAYISLEIKGGLFYKYHPFFQVTLIGGSRVLSCVVYCLVSLLFRFEKPVSWVLASSLFKVPLWMCTHCSLLLRISSVVLTP